MISMQITGGIPSFNQQKAQDLYKEPMTDEQREADNHRRSISRGKVIKGSVFNQRQTNINQSKIEILLKQLDESTKHIFFQNLQKNSYQERFESIKQETLDLM